MTKPKDSGPHSDLSGVHQDERSNVQTAVESGQDAADLERARKLGKGRPAATDEGKSRTGKAGAP